MGIYIETFILYIILFLANSVMAIVNPPVESTHFSFFTAFYTIILYLIPSLAVLWYLIFKSKKKTTPSIKPKKNDLIACLISFPSLLFIGFSIAFLPVLFRGFPISASPHIPEKTQDWIILFFLCLFSAYLEESFFRYYLLSKRKELKMNQIQALIFSVVLFSVCHIYLGPLGVLNAVLSGTLLSFIFLRYRSLHGIAIAHALYNVSVYLINNFFPFFF